MTFTRVPLPPGVVETEYSDVCQPVGAALVKVVEDADGKWSAWVVWDGRPVAHVRRFSKETAMMAGKSEARTEHQLRGMTLPMAFIPDDV